MALHPDALATQGARVKRLLPRVLPSAHPSPHRRIRTRAPLVLEALETRTLLAAAGVVDPASDAASWLSAVMTDQGVTIHLETTAQDHTLVLRGDGGNTALTLNTDRLAPGIDRIAVENVDWIRLLGSRSFETIELNHVQYADLGRTSISLVLYASEVDRLQVNSTDLVAVINGGSTLVQSERLNNALFLTNATELRLSSTHVVPSLSVVSLSAGNTVALDFSVGELSMVNFTAPLRLLPFDRSLLNAPAAPFQTQVSAPAVVPVVSTPAAPDIPGDGLEPAPGSPSSTSDLFLLFTPTASPVAQANAPVFTPISPSFFEAPAADGSSPALRTDGSAFELSMAITGGEPSFVRPTREITPEVGEVLTTLPADLGGQLSLKLAALPFPATSALYLELAHLLTQALSYAPFTASLGESKLVLTEPASPETSARTPASGGEVQSDLRPGAESAALKRARPDKGNPAVANVWERVIPVSGSRELSFETASASGQEAEVESARNGVGLSAEVSAVGGPDRSTSTPHLNKLTAKGSPVSMGDADQLLLFPLPAPLPPGDSPASDHPNSAAATSAEKAGGWMNALTGVGNKLASDWSERLWPYSRPVQVAELKAYLVEQFLAEITPGERSLLLLDPARLRPAPFGLV